SSLSAAWAAGSARARVRPSSMALKVLGSIEVSLWDGFCYLGFFSGVMLTEKPVTNVVSAGYPPRSEGRDDGALVVLEDVLAHFLGVQRGDQLADRGILLALGGGHHDVRVGRIRAFDEERILDRVQAGLEGVVGVDQGHVHVRQHARQGGRLELVELEMLEILDHVARRRENIAGILERDQAL